MTSNQPIVIGLGEFLWDLLPTGKHPGGAPSNFAIHSNQLGARGTVVSAVGQDSLGNELLAWLTTMGLSTDHVQVHACHKTGTVTVDVDSDGQPRFIIHENVAWDFLQWRSGLSALAQQADCVCVGSLAQRSPQSADTIQRFLDTTRPDCLRIFDLNLRQHYFETAVINRTLDKCDVFKLNADEWLVIARLAGVDPSVPAGPKELLKRHKLRLVALTRGSEGSLLIDQDRVLDRPADPVHVVDTVGAGDAFTAALAMGMLQNRKLEEVHAHADSVARYVCGQAGATPQLPDHLIDSVTIG